MTSHCFVCIICLHTHKYCTNEKTFEIQNDILELEKLSRFVDELANELQLKPDLVFNLNLVLEEAVANIMLYAYPQQTKGEIVIQSELHGNSLVFTVTDSGIPFDPTKVAEADITLSGEERPIGGLGIFLIKQIMDEVKYHRAGGRNVFMLKRIYNKV